MFGPFGGGMFGGGMFGHGPFFHDPFREMDRMMASMLNGQFGQFGMQLHAPPYEQTPYGPVSGSRSSTGHGQRKQGVQHDVTVIEFACACSVPNVKVQNETRRC